MTATGKITLAVFIATMLACIMPATAQNTIDKQGRKQGHWIKTDKDGSKIFEGDFKDGVEVGTFRYYYPDGTIRMVNEFEKGSRRCRHEAYDNKGRKIADGFYNQKNRDGEWHYYAEDGRLVQTSHYRMGVREGEQLILDAKNDTAELSNWKDGKRHGYWWKRIGTNGYITGTYKDGGLHGEMFEYDDSLRLRHYGNYYEGVRNGSFEHYEDGILSIKEIYENGMLTEREIRIQTPDTVFISIFDIAYLIPKGTAMNKVLLVNKKGEQINTFEPADNLYYRLGNDHFFMANKNQRIMVANNSIKGIISLPDGSKYLDLDPAPDFKIYPDEDCVKAVESLQYGAGGIPED